VAVGPQRLPKYVLEQRLGHAESDKDFILRHASVGLPSSRDLDQVVLPALREVSQPVGFPVAG
jgi:hypothetical protein